MVGRQRRLPRGAVPVVESQVDVFDYQGGDEVNGTNAGVVQEFIEVKMILSKDVSENVCQFVEMKQIL